jgi:hypothetical protein
MAVGGCSYPAFRNPKDFLPSEGSVVDPSAAENKQLLAPRRYGEG